MLRQIFNVDIGYLSLFEVIGTVASYAATVPITIIYFKIIILK